jgi:hypothetical protein
VTAAIFFVSLLSFFLTRMYWKKNRHQSLYNMASNGEIVSDISVFFLSALGQTRLPVGARSKANNLIDLFSGLEK